MAETPLALAACTSASTRAWVAGLSITALNLARSIPSEAAAFSSEAWFSSRWWSNIQSCISQNLPCAWAATAARAAVGASGCIGSGRWRNTKRTSLP